MAIVTTLQIAVLAGGHYIPYGKKAKRLAVILRADPHQEGRRNGVRSGMTREQRQRWYRGLAAGQCMLSAGALLVMLSSVARAQDIRGLEVCTAEKQMERRTGCLQANVEFLQQTLNRLTLETQDKMAATSRELAAAQTEIAELKSTMANLNDELARLKAKVEHNGGK
jgi:septal ring factor EnvC (AmiA/AmiB activator)